MRVCSVFYIKIMCRSSLGVYTCRQFIRTGKTIFRYALVQFLRRHNIMITIIMIYELMFTCVIFAEVGTMPVGRLTNFKPTSLVDHDPTAVIPPSNLDISDKIDVKKLLGMLHILNEDKSAQVSETTSLPSSTVINVVHDFDYSKECKIDEDSSRNQVTDLMILNTVYDRVSEHIKSVYETIQKNYDVLMKLNILKGMLMMGDTSIQSKGSTPWIKYMSKYKNFVNSY